MITSLYDYSYTLVHLNPLVKLKFYYHHFGILFDKTLVKILAHYYNPKKEDGSKIRKERTYLRIILTIIKAHTNFLAWDGTCEMFCFQIIYFFAFSNAYRSKKMKLITRKSCYFAENYISKIVQNGINHVMIQK